MLTGAKIRRPILASSVLESNKLAATRYPLPNTHLPNTKISDYPKYQNVTLTKLSADPSGVERVENPPTHLASSVLERIKIPNTRCPIPTTQYPAPHAPKIPYIPYPIPTTFSGYKLRARAMAMAWSLGHGLRLGDIALGLVP